MPPHDISHLPRQQIEPQVLASLARRDFAHAHARAPGFARWSDFDEFRQERDALYLGYGVSGVTARIQRVPFEAFERWAKLTGAPVDLNGLDEFAAHWRWRASHPLAPVTGRFGAPGDPERNAVAVAGLQTVWIRPEVYVRWRDEFARSGLFAAPDVDVYAAHVVDCSIASARRPVRRPALNSASRSQPFDDKP
ncbi:MAG: hypothetical protein KGM15_16745 [Pseudomonadota bacterium]|nr:hypothetical protein [Pseudomonadota bacterium]